MIGKAISHNRVTEKLGKGGMGEAYRPTDIPGSVLGEAQIPA